MRLAAGPFFHRSADQLSRVSQPAELVGPLPVRRLRLDQVRVVVLHRNLVGIDWAGRVEWKAADVVDQL